MPRKLNPCVVPGARFGNMVVKEILPQKQGQNRRKVLCQCDCGTFKEVSPCCLVSGDTKSCGCFAIEVRRKNGRARATSDKGVGLVIPNARFSRLLVIQRIEENGYLTKKVRCICDCGKEVIKNIYTLVYGGTNSCGCLASENTAARNKANARHGGYIVKDPKTSSSWGLMIKRCYKPNCKDFPNYGAVGIVVCEYLKASPRNLAAVIGKRPDNKGTIDRFPDNDGSYTCGQCEECKKNGWKLNVRWASKAEQNRNKSSNVRMVAFGLDLVQAEWERLTGLDKDLMKARRNRGWDAERILLTPDRKGNCYRP